MGLKTNASHKFSWYKVKSLMEKSIPDDRWKQKYIQFLDEQEKKDVDWEQTQSLLKKIISRLCILTASISPEFELTTSKLRQALFGESNSILNDCLNQLESDIEHAEMQEGQRQQALANALHSLLDQLRMIPGTSAEQIERMNIDSQALDSLARCAAWLSDYAQLQQSVFGKFIEPSSASTARSDDGQAVQVATYDPVIDNKADPLRLNLDRIASILSQCLANLKSLKTDLNLEAMEEAIAQGLSIYELEIVIAELSQAISSVVVDYQREFTVFLSHLFEKLKTVQMAIGEREHFDLQGKTNRRHLETQLLSEVRHLESTMKTAVDLNSLQTGIQFQINSIVAALTDFREKETQRESQLAAQLKQMGVQLSQMESESEQLKKQIQLERTKATTDALTSIANRQGFEDRIIIEYQRFQRYGKPLSLAIADVDHFKNINDLYGHSAGDKVLRVIARELNQSSRECDFVARYGGEEFVLILPETKTSLAVVALEKLKDKIAHCPFRCQNKPVTITISIGVTEFNKSESVAVVLRRADQALYQAKALGRNRVETG